VKLAKSRSGGWADRSSGNRMRTIVIVEDDLTCCKASTGFCRAWISRQEIYIGGIVS